MALEFNLRNAHRFFAYFSRAGIKSVRKSLFFRGAKTQWPLSSIYVTRTVFFCLLFALGAACASCCVILSVPRAYVFSNSGSAFLLCGVACASCYVISSVPRAYVFSNSGSAFLLWGAACASCYVKNRIFFLMLKHNGT